LRDSQQDNEFCPTENSFTTYKLTSDNEVVYQFTWSDCEKVLYYFFDSLLYCINNDQADALQYILGIVHVVMTDGGLYIL